MPTTAPPRAPTAVPTTHRNERTDHRPSRHRCTKSDATRDYCLIDRLSVVNVISNPGKSDRTAGLEAEAGTFALHLGSFGGRIC